MKKLTICLETEKDYRTVENITREAFWNIYVPGCDEHYFVHMMRSHEDFIPELAFVLKMNGEIIGNIMYTKTKLVDENGNEKQTLTFGPLSILPEYQRQGYGKMLIEHSFKKAIDLGFDTVVIFGNPENYVSRGFKSCKKLNVCIEGNIYPSALLVKELCDGALGGRKWRFCDSSASESCVDTEAVEAFDATFSPKEKAWQPSQEEFYIHSHSSIVR